MRWEAEVVPLHLRRRQEAEEAFLRSSLQAAVVWSRLQ